MTLPEPASTPVNDLADRFWEAILELNPTTATFYGDDRYADRLEDPGPEGRARARALMERTAAEATAIDDRRPADRGPDHPRHAQGHRRAPDRGGRPGPPPAPRRRPDGRPAAAPAAADPVPAGRHARTARGVHRSAPRLPGVHGRQRAAPARRPGLGSHRAAHRRRADHRPDRADARGPDRVGHRAVDGQGRLGGGPRARPRRRPRRRLSGRPGVPRHAPRRLPGGDARGPGRLVGAQRRAALPHRDPELDDARPRSRGGPPDRTRRARLDRGRAPRDRPRGRLRR